MTDEDQVTNLRIRILLVEDQPLIRFGIKTLLQREADLDVVGEATNGEEAVAQAEALKPDVILMDVGLPEMDGIQASQKIVESGNTAKIIMLTTYEDEQSVLASLAAGASGYCLKDVESSRLYMAVRTVNAGDSWLDSAVAGKVLNIFTKQEPTAVTNPDTAFPQKEAYSSAHSEQGKKPYVPDRPYSEVLSPRELEVLSLIVDGHSNQQISNRLNISLPTTKTHVRNILNKLAVDDRTQAAVHAMRRGIVL